MIYGEADELELQTGGRGQWTLIKQEKKHPPPSGITLKTIVMLEGSLSQQGLGVSASGEERGRGRSPKEVLINANRTFLHKGLAFILQGTCPPRRTHKHNQIKISAPSLTFFPWKLWREEGHFITQTRENSSISRLLKDFKSV